MSKLWHSVSERPAYNRADCMHGCHGIRLVCLVKTEPKISGEYATTVVTLYFRINGMFCESWQDTVKSNRIIMWCYFDEVTQQIYLD